MKKIFFLFAMLSGVAASAQSTVQITPVSATYTATSTIQFKVSWTNQTTANHRNKVWIFVDFQPVISPTQKGNWQPATITGTVQKTAGTVSGQSSRGFFLEGTATNFSSTITVQLSNTGKFNWCAYGSDFPPNATIANGTYTLKGSPPFKITYNSGSYIETDNKSFTLGCIASFTDATGCPGIINYPAFSAGALGNGSWGRMGEFLNIGGTPLTIVNAAGANGGSGKLTYKWFKNNAEISGATAVTYLPPKADATVAGTFNYVRKAYDGMCNTAGTTASGTWTNVVGGPASTVTGCNIYVAMYNFTLNMNWADANAGCNALGSGWRLPTMNETASCFCSYRDALNLTPYPLQYPNVYAYWISTTVNNINNTGASNSCPGQNTYGMFHTSDYSNPDWSGAQCSSGNWTWCPTVSTVHVRCVKSK